MDRFALLKLTGYYVALLTIMALIFSATFFVVSHQQLATGLRNQIEDIDNGTQDNDVVYQAILREHTRQFAVTALYYDLGFVAASVLISYALARKTMQPIRQSAEAQTRFVAEASHELRTPLSNMLLESQVVLRRRDPSAGQLQKILRANVRDVQRLQALTDMLLDVVRYQSKALFIEKHTIRLDQLVKQAARLSQKNNNLVTINCSTITSRVDGDKLALFQALRALLDNATKYSHKDGQVAVSMYLSQQAVLIVIKDSGLGIKRSELKKIFNSFYRSTEAEVQKRHGFGLGLPLARQIIKAHGGRLAVQSKLGVGSTFTVSLPLAGS